MEPQKTSNSSSNTKKEEQSWSNHTTWYQNLMQICCSAHWVISNVTTTQYTCSLNGVSRPHWLVQWSRHCSRMCIPVHSSWLPAYISVVQTILVILQWLDFFIYNKKFNECWGVTIFLPNIYEVFLNINYSTLLPQSQNLIIF